MTDCLTVYHATPFRFNHLRCGSWVSTSRFEAAFHLFQKNYDNEEVDDLLGGWVITIPHFNTRFCLDYIDTGGVIHMTTSLRLDVTPYRIRLRDVIDDLAPWQQAMFAPTEIYDLRSLLT